MALSAGENINNPPQGAPEIAAAAGRGRGRARRQTARLAGAQAQGLPARPRLRELNWRGKAGIDLRLSRARQGAAAAFPVRISRWRVVRRGDAPAERRGFAIGRAAAACAARRFDDRSFDRAVRPALEFACWPRAGRAVGPLRAARRSPGGEGGRRPRNVPFTLSTVSACSLREVARVGPRPWYPALFRQGPRVCRGDDRTRAKAAGCGALILTVDLAVPGSRYRDARAAGGGPRRMGAIAGARPRWLWDVGSERQSAQPRQSRSHRRQARAAERFPGVDPRQFRRLGELEGRRMGARAVARAADPQGHPRPR